MCDSCGCDDNSIKHEHSLGHEHGHDHDHKQQAGSGSREIIIEKEVLSENDRLAAANRKWLAERQIFCLNLISSPGSGKTTLLERTLDDLGGKYRISVLVGDQKTDNDAKRMEGRGARVRQINTHSSCHLDAHQVLHELPAVCDGETDILIIENIGNLVCPSAFDLGEHHKVALLSCTEGEDKPVKYPVLFNRAGCILITKSDLIPHLDWDEVQCREYITQVNHGASVISLSAKTGDKMDAWYYYLESQLELLKRSS